MSIMYNWLFGPPMAPEDLGTPGPTRGLTLEIELMPELVDYFGLLLLGDQPRPPMKVHYMVMHPGQNRPVTTPLEDLSVYDRNNLYVWVEEIDRGAEMHYAVHNSQVRVNGRGEVDTDAMVRKLQSFLLTAGKPRISWARVRMLGLWLVPAAFLASYIWLAVSTPLEVPLHFMLLILLGILIAGVARTVRSRRITGYPVVPTVFQPTTRADIYARKANTRRDIRVSLITLAITAPVSIVGTVIAAALTGD